MARAFPFAARDVDADGVRLRVVDDGPRGARGTLLFLHGNPAWGFLWRELLARAVRAGHRVVAPDLAGLGRSGKPLDPAYHTLDRHARNLERVAEELDLRGLTLVLHDWGGPIGMALAARQPDRVARIVATNTTAFAPRSKRAFSAWHAALGSAPGQWLARRTDLVARTAFRWGVQRPLPREVRAAYAWPMRERGARIAAASLVRMVPDGPEHPTARALRAIEDKYGALQDKPVLVLWADRDPVLRPGLAERWRRSFPHAEVRHVAPGAGHFWQEDEPGAFAAPLLLFAAA